MKPPTSHTIRRIFLTPRPNVALMTAAELLGITLKELKRDINDGVIVAVSTGLGMRISKEELIAVAMGKWDQIVIEAALGDDAASVLPGPSASWSCGRVCRGTSAMCYASWRGAMAPRSMQCWRGSWRTWPQRTRRSWWT
jgi:hypothetical protein